MTSWLMRLALIGAVACGGGTPAPQPPDVPPVGGEGAVCRAGRNQPPDATVVVHACAEGLQCCYPCGIEGCDSVCMADCGPPRP